MGKPVTLDTLFRTRTPGSPRWSPDGARLVFPVQYASLPRDGRGSELWTWVPGQQAPCRLTAGRKADGAPAAETHPCWSPDGREVAFLSDRSGETQVWIIPVSGGEAYPVSGSHSGCGAIMADAFFAGLEWSPDGASIAFAAQLPDPDPPDPSRPRVAGMDYGETYPHVRARIHVWTTAPEGGAARRLTDGEYDHGDPRWSPDGRWVVFVSNRTADQGPVSASINKNYDLWLVPAEGGPERRLTSNWGPDFSPRWSPDGRRIAYLAGDRCGPHRDQYRLCVLDVETRRTADLTGEWDPLPEPLASQCWLPDGRSLLFSAWAGTETHLYRAGAEARGIETLSSGRLVLSAPAVSPDGAWTACACQGERSPGEIEVRAVPATRAGGAGAAPVTAATRFNAWLDEYSLAEVELLSWPSDEWRIEGILVRPAGGEPGPRPALLFAHGGPHHRVTCALNLEWQWLAARGYGVLAPNFRGSAGYGRAFLDADRRDWGGGDYRDLMRGADCLVEARIADAGRLGILGGSYGGYLTAWTVTATNRFRAAVARAPITNLLSYFGTTDLRTLTEWDLGGSPWECAELYRERSPITHAARVRTPTLLLHGEADRRVPVSQSEEMHAALSRREVPVVLVRYPGAGHLISRPSHVDDYWTRTIEWFDRYLS